MPPSLRPPLLAGTLLLSAMAALCQSAAATESPKAEDFDKAEFGSESKSGGPLKPWLLRAQVLLDRMRLSPGVIDGLNGENFRQALAEFERRTGVEGDGKISKQAWEKLTATSTDPIVIQYEISENDVKGPFTPEIPKDLEEIAKLDRLGYRDAREGLAEKFHMDEDALDALNPGKKFDKAGERILVANVGKAIGPAGKVTRIEVDKSERSLRALDEKGETLAYVPATIGSEDKPTPEGTHKVRAIAENPTWSYNPDFKFKGVKTDKKVELKAGPNNPIGSTWIDLTEETYGIHGTPEPSKVGKTESHGCVRLTNWDVKMLAGMVDNGTVVEFID